MVFEILGETEIFFTATCNLCARRLIEGRQPNRKQSIAGNAQA
jgi:hypothetical protein